MWGGSTLYHLDDLPFPVQRIHSVFTSFRKSVEGRVAIRAPLDAPAVLKPTLSVQEADALLASLPRSVEFPFGGMAATDCNVGVGALPSMEALGALDASGLLTIWQRQFAQGRRGRAGVAAAAAPTTAATTDTTAGATAAAAAATTTAPTMASAALAHTAPSVPAAGSVAASVARSASGTIADDEVWAQPPSADPRGVMKFVGGATAAAARMKDWMWDRGCVAAYKETRNGLLGGDYSSKFSPWLASGSLSARTIYAELKRYEEVRGANESTYWLVFELMWRDFFRFSALAWGTRLFHLWGPTGTIVSGKMWRDEPAQFHAWATGTTGYPFVDANMIELAATGFMSNRGRQNVASFFTKDMSHDWRHGAEWMEALLLDHSCPENFGNWNAIAHSERNYFLIPKQGREYDPEARYIKHWLPQLARLAPGLLHSAEAGAARAAAAAAAGGPQYAMPIVPLLAQRHGGSTEGHRYRNQGHGRSAPVGAASAAAVSAPSGAASQRDGKAATHGGAGAAAPSIPLDAAQNGDGDDCGTTYGADAARRGAGSWKSGRRGRGRVQHLH